jgi:hypothetical protein
LNANRMSPTVVQVVQSCRPARGYADPRFGSALRIDVRITLLAAGLIFLLALVLGVWKYRQIIAAEDHRAHPYVDIAHRAALLYSFATLLVAIFVVFSAWPAWVNLTAAMLVVFFFVGAIVGTSATVSGATPSTNSKTPTGHSRWGWRCSSPARSAASG